jgi:hypothetical protein
MAEEKDSKNRFCYFENFLSSVTSEPSFFSKLIKSVFLYFYLLLVDILVSSFDSRVRFRVRVGLGNSV